MAGEEAMHRVTHRSGHEATASRAIRPQHRGCARSMSTIGAQEVRTDVAGRLQSGRTASTCRTDASWERGDDA
jgi:hypothetical protein